MSFNIIILEILIVDKVLIQMHIYNFIIATPCQYPEFLRSVYPVYPHTCIVSYP